MLDALARTGYRAVYWAARLFWFVTRPHTAGAVVAVWCGTRVLLVRSSYRPQYALPGGFVSKGETPADAASRELFEETQIRIPAAQLRLAWRGVMNFESRQDTITIFEAAVGQLLAVEPNRREVVWAGWKTAGEALALELLPHVRDYLAEVTPGRGDHT